VVHKTSCSDRLIHARATTEVKDIGASKAGA